MRKNRIDFFIRIAYLTAAYVPFHTSGSNGILSRVFCLFLNDVFYSIACSHKSTLNERLMSDCNFFHFLLLNTTCLKLLACVPGWWGTNYQQSRSQIPKQIGLRRGTRTSFKQTGFEDVLRRTGQLSLLQKTTTVETVRKG